MRTIAEIIEDKKESILELEKFLYDNPEIEMEEFKAKEKFIELLTRENFIIEENIEGLPTAFVAYKNLGEGPSIGICAEYDALPGMGHACGHNLIGATSFGTAVALAEWMSETKHTGKVYLFGTPAEETGRGKPGLLKAGWFKNVDVVMMSHPMKQTVLTLSNVNLEGYDITFHGRASHAASAPENGKNALDAAVTFYNSISMLRQQLRDGSRVHMIFTDGGRAVNIIPDTATVRVEIRHNDFTYFRDIVNKVYTIAESAASANGCTFSINMFEPPIACVKSNMIMVNLFKNALHNVGINEYVDNLKSGGCSDIGNVSQEVPTLYPCVKMVRDTSDAHTREFLEDADAPFAVSQMYTVAECLAEVGVSILEKPHLLQEIKKDFEKIL